MIATNNDDQLVKAQALLMKQMSNLKRNAFKRWIVTAVGFILACILSIFTNWIATKLGLSLYNRSGLDKALTHYFGNATFDDIIQNELLVNSYEFNSKTPRFFSKTFQEISPGRYTVPLRDAVGGSSSAPLYFDPK